MDAAGETDAWENLEVDRRRRLVDFVGEDPPDLRTLEDVVVVRYVDPELFHDSLAGLACFPCWRNKLVADLDRPQRPVVEHSVDGILAQQVLDQIDQALVFGMEVS